MSSDTKNTARLTDSEGRTFEFEVVRFQVAGSHYSAAPRCGIELVDKPRVSDWLGQPFDREAMLDAIARVEAMLDPNRRDRRYHRTARQRRRARINRRGW